MTYEKYDRRRDRFEEQTEQNPGIWEFILKGDETVSAIL